MTTYSLCQEGMAHSYCLTTTRHSFSVESERCFLASVCLLFVAHLNPLLDWDQWPSSISSTALGTCRNWEESDPSHRLQEALLWRFCHAGQSGTHRCSVKGNWQFWNKKTPAWENFLLLHFRADFELPHRPMGIMRAAKRNQWDSSRKEHSRKPNPPGIL